MNEWYKKVFDSILFLLSVTVLITALGVLLAAKGEWFWVSILFLVLVAVCRRVRTVNRKQVKKVAFLLEAIENNDYSLRFAEEKVLKEDIQINRLLNRVERILHETKSEIARQEKYYELILNYVSTGIVVLNANGAVYQKNNEALRLLGLDVFTHVSQLHKVDAVLADKITLAKTGEKLQAQFSNEYGQVNLSVRVSDVVIKKEHLRILVLNDIHTELDAKELDSWTRLIRVLTHEIMNSITPITSLSDTLLTHADTGNEEMRNGLQVISSTGKGLLSFVDSYRKFTRIPTPEPSLFYVAPFVSRMIALARHQNPCDNITFRSEVVAPDLILYADEQLVSQVVINLLKNAIEAIGGQSGGSIGIKAYANEAEEVVLEVSNNGPQIPPDVAGQIFVPFFTTREKGSGIGLSLSRQIMRLSGGSIVLLPYSREGLTTFVLRF